MSAVIATVVIDATVVAAFFTGLALLVGALTAAYVKIRNTQRNIAKTQKVIHKAVNSNMEAAMKKIAELQDRLEGIPYTLDDGTNAPQPVHKKQRPTDPAERKRMAQAREARPKKRRVE